MRRASPRTRVLLLIGPTPRQAGVVALIVGLAITLTNAALRGWDAFLESDGHYFQTVAGDLDAGDAARSGLAYRYGRVGLPLVARSISLGRDSLLVPALTLVTPVAFAAIVALAVAIARRVRRSGWAGLVVLVVPGLWYGFAFALADVLLAACALTVVWATLARRDVPAVAGIALAALTKEIGVICGVASAMAAACDGDRRRALVRLAGLIPAGLWWLWVWSQAGQLPFLAQDRARSSAIAPPFVAIVRAFSGGPGDPLAAVLALLVGVAGLAVICRIPREPLAWHAALWAASTVCLGTNVLGYPLDAIRVMTPAMCVIGVSMLLLDWSPPRSARDRAGKPR